MKQTKKQIVENYIRKIVKQTINEAKQAPELPNTNLTVSGFGRDVNGNAVIKLKFFDGSAFSIQTNGNLPKTDSLGRRTKASELTPQDLQTIATEVTEYISNYGSAKQKSKLKVWGK